MKIIYHIILLFFAVLYQSGFAQYPPPVGQEGSTAIHKDSSVFIDWASTCTVERGFLDISQPELGFVDYGFEEEATGQADNSVVSLGDAGVATLSFETPLANGEGFDFAVFENGFTDSFLELAFVEVSSDGENYVRFNNVSLTQTGEQVGGFGELNTELINNLAGKYRVEYGTPFDLQELTDITGLDVNHITHVRIVDVVGCIQDNYARYDSEGHKINEPWPTPFPSGGFDLDAVGVINNINSLSVTENDSFEMVVYPNPIPENVSSLQLRFNADNKPDLYSIIGLNGIVITSVNEINKNMTVIDFTDIAKGIYILKIVTGRGVITKKIIRD